MTSTVDSTTLLADAYEALIANVAELATERDALRAENEALRKDAERYRHLLSMCGHAYQGKFYFVLPGRGECHSPEELSAAIDIAMNEQSSTQLSASGSQIGTSGTPGS